MAPTVETPRPKKNSGEREFADKLEPLLNQTTHVWYNYLPPQGFEIDVILASKIGFFCIEVKAVPLHMIYQYDLHKCQIAGRPASQNPVAQARSGMFKLKLRLDDVAGKDDMPWLIPVAAFSRVNRSEFILKFASGTAGQKILREHIDGLIFADDLVNEEAFEQRIQHISKNPSLGRGSRKAVSDAQISLFIETLGSATTVPEDPGNQFSITIGKPRKDSIKKLIEPGNRGSTIINGLPGSGKTQALLDIAVNHAHNGRRVLVTCFNKVLASKLRTDLDRIDLDERTHNQLIIADVFKLGSIFKGDKALQETFREFFNTVCVDEAQDLQKGNENLLDKIEGIVSSSAEWFFACGRDQELYGTKPKQVIEAEKIDENVHELRRPSYAYRHGFRESTLAQIGFNFSFDDRKTEKAASELLNRVKTDHDTGESLIHHFKTHIKMSHVSKDLPNEYRNIIMEELDLLESIGVPNDLMILTPKKSRQENADILAAINSLPSNVQVFNQVADENRRMRLPQDYIRFVTVHSSRGLQASRVIIFLPHKMEAPEGNDKKVENAMAYIALSRAMNGTHVVRVDGQQPSRFQNFVEGTITAYKNAIFDDL